MTKCVYTPDVNEPGICNLTVVIVDLLSYYYNTNINTTLAIILCPKNYSCYI